jgi:hypothetical protein
MKRWDSPLRNARAAAVFAGALAVLTFLNSLANGFAFDDKLIISENEAIQSLGTLPGALVAPYWPGEHGQSLALWRPVATGLYGLEWSLWGGSPAGYHLLNVALHGAVTGLVVVLLAEFIPVAAAFAGGLAFAVHPIHVEAISNVVGRAEVLSAFFFLLGCILLVRGGMRLGAGRLVLILVTYALAFLTKESAVTFLGIVFLLDGARENLTPRDLGGYLRRRWPLYLGLVVIAGAILYARFRVLGNVARPFPPLGADILEEIPRIWTVAATWPHIVRLFFFPLDLVVDYGPAVIPISFGWNAANLVGVTIVLTVLTLCLVTWRKGQPLSSSNVSGRALGFGVLWFVITLSPTSNVFFLSGILLSERTLYLPSVGFVAVLGWVVLELHRTRPRLVPVVFVVALLLLGARSWTRTPTWESDSEVFNTLIQEHPESGRSQWVLADLNFRAGRTSEALRAYRMAVGLLGGHYSLMVEMGRVFMSEGYDDAAELILTFAWRDRPEFGVAPGLLANIYDRQGRHLEAEEVSRLRLAEDSTDAVQYHLLSRALEAQERYSEAAEARRASIRHGEGDHWEQWSWLARLQMASGDSVGAEGSMDSARARAQTQAESRQIDSLLQTILPGPLPGDRPPDSANNSQKTRFDSRSESQ